MKNYLDKFDNFYDSKIELALEDYIIFHNQTKKYSTKYALYEIRDIDDKNLINIVLNNMIKNFKKHIIKENEILDMNEKLLLWNNLIKRNNIYEKNNKDKKGDYIYPCIFQDYSNSDTIKIIFEIDINSEFVKNKNILYKLDCFIIVHKFVFNYFIIKNNKT